ncbi:TetR/AcrR family transcriptional regulator [Marinobacterium sp. BA1]|uniref:TetR/AcrR family transcriptional regulator n=1 Tax=Marinobacterium sp. BA1 TaxID=3138931 RepID=UPI0034E8CE79
MSSTAEKIMDVAETLIRARGYQGFAFREIADAVGIKSASVHYHFPTKGDLVLATMDRYAQRFELALNNIDSKTEAPIEKLNQYIEMFRREMHEDRNLTLCIMLGADIAVVPDTVVKALKEFYSLNLNWLSTQLSESMNDQACQNLTSRASYMLASLHGALIGARSLNEHHYFEMVVAELERELIAPK